MNLKNPILRIGLFAVTFIVSFVFTLGVRVASGFKSEAIPVALVPAGAYSESQSITMKLQWGGFYAVREGDSYQIFRLLDINPDYYHVVSYSETFRDIPTIHDVSFLIPEREHVALKGIDILSQKPVFIGRKSLGRSDLESYGNYLLRTGYKISELGGHINRVINLSRDIPFETKLSNKEGSLDFDQAGY